MQTFRTLDLAVEFYKHAQKAKVPIHLRDQLNRASSSISLNLAEGNAKFSYKDKARIYQIAYGSLRECQAIFRLIEADDPELLALSKHLEYGGNWETPLCAEKSGLKSNCSATYL